MTTQLEVANEALAQIGTRSALASLSDGSPEATYVSLLYAPVRDFLLVDGDYDFAMVVNALVRITGPAFPWNYRYEYPTNALRIRQLIPSVSVINDPRPIEWNISSLSGELVINTNVSVGGALCTMPANENLWDGMFRQSFVRMLASALAFALENRIEASKVKLDEALGFAGLAKLRHP